MVQGKASSELQRAGLMVAALQEGGLETSPRSCLCPDWKFQRCMGRTFPSDLPLQAWVHVLNECGFEE